MKMNDLSRQYLRLKKEIDKAVQTVFKKADFINGEPVKSFCDRLATYLGIPYVIPCGNATDALRLALKALEIGTENDVIVPAFTYIAPLEAIASVGASPIVVDVDPRTFNINPLLLERAMTAKTKAILAVHLFGQSADMEAIQKIADKYKLFIIEDNAQSLGANYTFSDGRQQKAGTIGQIGVTSFFPTKPLGCYGDGGALFTSDENLAETLRLLTNHGQTKKYYHQIIGYNSRLDTVQAAILNVKLNHLEAFTERARQLASNYDNALDTIPELTIPEKIAYSTHVYHQYTIQVKNGKRDALKDFLSAKGIPTMIYYPLPIHEQEAYKWVARLSGNLTEAIRLCHEVLSLPIHTELTDDEQSFIIETIHQFFTLH